MRYLILIVLVYFVSSLSAETVYKTVDENGNVIFTDKPSEDAEEIKVDKLQTIKNPNPGKFKPLPKKQEKLDLYKTFIVTNPANDSALRNNAGNVSISLNLEPTLRSGHKVIISVDGNEVASGSSLSARLQNVDRGTHNISAKVVDDSGKTLISTSSSFSLLRASR